MAVVLAVSPTDTGQPGAVAATTTDKANGADEFEATMPDAPVPGSVGVAVPRGAGFPDISSGSIVHAVAVNDPLVTGEVRDTVVVVRSARVLNVDDAAVTIEVAEAEALSLVEAIATGSVVLVSVGER